MRKLFTICLYTFLLVYGIGMVSCKGKAVEAPLADEESDTTVVDTTYIMAINQYICDVIGRQYVQSDVCIPCAYTVAVDETNKEDILVWGNFWVYNYQIIGDLLKTVSRGSHSGLMHVCKKDGCYEVTHFDAVADGAGYEESAKKIFGEKYEELNRLTSNEEKREMMRRSVIADYVREHRLPISRYKDDGWPAATLPKK